MFYVFWSLIGKNFFFCFPANNVINFTWQIRSYLTNIYHRSYPNISSYKTWYQTDVGRIYIIVHLIIIKI